MTFKRFTCKKKEEKSFLWNMITQWLRENFCSWKFFVVGAFQNSKSKFCSWWRFSLVVMCLDTDVLRCCKWTHLLGIPLVTFILNCRHLLFRHERFSCRERITFMQTPLFYKHLVADHLTEKIIHCRSQEFSVISPGSLLSSTLSLKGEKGGWCWI